ncbi:hypothetical protein ACFU3E_31885 [Streptomyces sp. NPDC057424]|uniref:hypothetical protein n=1 Tax=Streptomyces sp. NPDC057424 TaxID=3346127 RepID=UPI0036C674A1
MSTGARRIVAWLVGAVCLAVVSWLVVTAVLDLPTGDSTASVVAAVVAVIGLGLSGITLLRTPGSTGSGPGSGRTLRVRARGRGSIAAGGDVRGNAVGARAKVTGATGGPAGDRPGRGERDVSARGTGAIGAGGNIVDNAIGEDSER